MSELELGDEVHVGNDEYDRMYAFGHRNLETKMTFLQIHVEGMGKPLELTTGHLIYIANRKAPVPASMLEIGDQVLLADGVKNDEGRAKASVVRIEQIERRGVFTPLTMSGQLAVNGILASSYISFQPHLDVLEVAGYKTPITWHWGSHAFQAPHRMFCRALPNSKACTHMSTCKKGYLYPTVALAVQVHWLFQEENSLWLVMALPFLSIFVFVQWLEDTFFNWTGLFLFVAAVTLGYLKTRQRLRDEKGKAA